MNISRQVVILSAELGNLCPVENSNRTRILRHCIEDCRLSFGEAQGVYKGGSEASFVVIVNNDDEIQALKDFAFKNFGQESVLYQDANQEAYLVFNDNSTKRLGRLQQTTKEVAENLDNYTILNGSYYATFKR